MRVDTKQSLPSKCLIKNIYPSLLLASMEKSIQGSELFLLSYCFHLWLINSFKEGLH